MNQVVDLEGHAEFQSLGVQLIAISTDPAPALTTVVEQYNVKTPHLSDGGGQVSGSYGSAQWAMHGSEPGHVFVLVGRDGKVRWIKDYGALANGGLMYVSPEPLYQEIVKHMPPPEQSLPLELERGGQTIRDQLPRVPRRRHWRRDDGHSAPAQC